MSNSQLNDIGTVLTITIQEAGVAVNISTATVKTIKIHKPTGTILSKTGVFTTTGADGKIYYTIIAADLDEVGSYLVQAYIEMPTGKWYSSIGEFAVFANIS